MSKSQSKQIIVNDWLKKHYGFSKNVQHKLLRTYTNDVYQIDDGTSRYVLKIYGVGWRTESEILWEIDLIKHLSLNNVAVALPVQAKNSKWLNTIVDGSNNRYAVLFEYAEGSKPKAPNDKTPIDLSLYRPFGRCIASMHLASDDFVSNHKRPKMDTAYLIGEARNLAEPLLKKSDRTFFKDFTSRLQASIEGYAESLDWGVCHGDATFDNVHITDDGRMVLYDFDSGGYCWRASELQGWAIFNGDEAKAKQNEFIIGYQEIRHLSQADIEAAPYLYEAFDVWGIKVDLQQRVLQKGKAVTDQYLSEQMQIFKERAVFLWQ